ncbi:MAG: SH3 domain-containing protein, partial [Burkholderiales bacterium]|nr:SH3 domain-containing protein [Anaerolineae bacterium]
MSISSLRTRRTSIITVFVMVLCALLSVFPFGIAAAQTAPAPIQYGTVVVGSLTQQAPIASYAFAGNAGDLVSIRVIGLTPGMTPTVTLLGPAQEELLTTVDRLMFPSSVVAGAPNTSAVIAYRLFANGTYVVNVGAGASGVGGDFVLTIDALPAVQAVPLVVQSPQDIVIPLTGPVQFYNFNTDPTTFTTLLVNFTPFAFNVFVEVSDSNGQTVSLVDDALQTACLEFGPGDETFQVAVLADPLAQGNVSLTLSAGRCLVGAPPAPADIVLPVVVFTPVPIPNVCAVSSNRNVNIRSGPGLQFPILTLLPRGQAIQAIARTETGWYAVQSNFVQGWVSGAVIFLSGPCEPIPVLVEPTPIVVTVTPTSTAQV